MRAAKAAGLRAVGHVPPYLPPSHADALRAAGADAVLHTMADLEAAVR
jgi:phosphoglycolate phosphatase-like HAD superfamily hydrolase